MDVGVGTILDLVILGVVAVGGVVLQSIRSGVDQAAADIAAEKVRQEYRQEQLDRVLEQVRGTERQELRFASYGELWAAMRPLAIYDDTQINREEMKTLSVSLSAWYFSKTGGLMLTSHNRELYFALQDLVRAAAASKDDWEANRRDRPEARFKSLLHRRHLRAALKLMRHLRDSTAQDWPNKTLQAMAEGWRADIKELASGWAEIDSQCRFAVLQQVSSVLRTGLANDVESRLR